MSDYQLAPRVVALRMPLLAREAERMARGQIAAPGRQESERMVTEKIVAVHEGLLQASVEFARVHMELGFMALRGDFFGMIQLSQAGPQRVAEAAAEPSHARVRHNIRRLDVPGGV